MATSSPAPRIAVINCDHTKDEFIKQFNVVPNLFRDLFSNYLQAKPAAAHPSSGGDTSNGWQKWKDGSFYFKGFNAIKSEWPDVAKEKIDCIVVGGSSNSVNDLIKSSSDLDWLKWLALLLADVAVHHPTVKLIGVCFGHQLLNHILYKSKIVPSSWEIGPFTVHLEDGYKYLFPGGDNLQLEMFHSEMAAAYYSSITEARDKVMNANNSFEHHIWGHSDTCKNEGTVVFYEGTDGKQVRILTLQGHPELTEPMAVRLLELFSDPTNKLESVPEAVAKIATDRMQFFKAFAGQLDWVRSAEAMWKVATGANFDKV
jgi:GMP synthase-like glutamine amidotransferase